MVECQLPKLKVASSSLVARSRNLLALDASSRNKSRSLGKISRFEDVVDTATWFGHRMPSIHLKL